MRVNEAVELTRLCRKHPKVDDRSSAKIEGAALRMDQRLGARNAFYTADLIVALEHVDEVARTLDRFGVVFADADRSEGLGLARVEVQDDRVAAATLGDAVLGELRAQGRPTPGWTATTDMDRVLAALRTHFAEQYAGWTPTLGKNRLVGHVVGGGGKISFGGGPGLRATEVRPQPRQQSPGHGVKVGVLDSSISAHPWLAGGWVSPFHDVLGAADGTHAVAGHATFVTGLVLSQAPACTVDVRGVLSDVDGESDSWTVAKEIVALGRDHVDVLNLSFVCYTEDGQPPLVLATAIDRLDARTVVVAAAGNHGDPATAATPDDCRKPGWPAALDDVIAVGAAHPGGEAAVFTPADAAWIDVLAPGVEVVSTYLTGRVDLRHEVAAPTFEQFDGFAVWSGTSFASALVSGAIAARTRPGFNAREAWAELRGPRGARSGPPFLDLQGVLYDAQPGT